MKSKLEIEQEVNKTLELLNEFETVPSNPFFFSKLKAKLDNEIKKKNYLSESSFYLGRIRYAFMYFIVVINLISIMTYFILDSSNTNLRSRTISELINEYNLNSKYSYESFFSTGKNN